MRMPGRLLVAAAVVGLVMVAPSPALGASAVPAEDTMPLPGTVVTALVGDVDGDGVRELVRVLPWETNPAQLGVDVVGIEDGRPAAHRPLGLRRESTPEDRDVVGRGPPDAVGMYPVARGDPVGLLVWRDGARERVLVATNGIQVFGACCLTLWEVTIGVEGQTQPRLLAETGGGADAVLAVDLDGDGVDEVAVVKPPDPATSGQRAVAVWRWAHGRFVDSGLGFQVPAFGSRMVDVGNTDGLPGDELAMVATVPLDEHPAVLQRLAIDPVIGARLDVLGLPFAGTPIGVPGTDASRIAVVSPNDGIALVDLAPPGGDVPSIEVAPQRGVPLAVLGRGDGARILLLRDGAAVDVLDGSLALRQRLQGTAAAAVFLSSDLPPFVGELPGGLPDGRPAVVFAGRMAVAPSGPGLRSDELETSPIAVLPGAVPIGAFGAGGAWMSVADAQLPLARREAVLVRTGPEPGASVTVARTADVLTPEADDGDLQPPLIGALRLSAPTSRATIAARDAFEFAVSAPPGSLVVFDAASPFVAGTVRVDRSGRGTVRVASTGQTDTSDASGPGRLLVATPGGHGYGATWEIQILRQAPPLHVEAEGAPLSATVELRGATAPGAEIMVDGRSVAVGSDGSFRAAVAAGLLPRDVVVVAADIVGNVSQARVSVVAFVDYRTLPWIPIVAILTVLMGGLLYLRTPRLRPSDRADDASFEEIV